MRFNLIPVMLTAAFTSVLTYFVAAQVDEHTTTPFQIGNSVKALPVNYTGDGNRIISAPGPVNFEAAAEASVKAVVHIKTATKARQVETNDLFGQLFGPQIMPPQMGSGSGVVISPDGYIVTNNHVVADANDVTVTFNDRLTATAKVIGADAATDIAVLKVDMKNLPYMEFGNSDNVKLGQWVLAVGYPLNLDATVTAGIVSAKARSLGINRSQSASAIESFIQTDAAVNPGNSGGALVNTSGQLVGINSAIASLTGSYSGYSYAIPANIVRKAANDLIKYGSVQRAILGIDYLDMKNATAMQISEYHIDKTDGVYVLNAAPQGGAAKAGILTGDFITQINGEAVHTSPEMLEKIARYHPGDNIAVAYLRNGKTNIANVQLTNMRFTTDVVKGNEMMQLFGASVRTLTDKERMAYNLNGVFVSSIGPGPIAKQTNMRKGFVILNVNGRGIASAEELGQAVSGNSAVLLGGFYPAERSGQMYYFQLKGLRELQ